MTRVTVIVSAALVLLVALAIPPPRAEPPKIAGGDRQTLDQLLEIPFGSGLGAVRRAVPALGECLEIDGECRLAEAPVRLFGLRMKAGFTFFENRLTKRTLTAERIAEEEARAIYEAMTGYFSRRLRSEPRTETDPLTDGNYMVHSYWTDGDVEHTLTHGGIGRRAYVGWNAYTTNAGR